MKKKTLHRIKIAHPTPGLHVGGKEHGMVNLVNRMSPEIFENYIFTFKQGGILSRQVDPQQCRVITLGNRPGGDVRIPFKLARHFRRHHFNIVHTRSWSTLLEGAFAAKAAGVPILIHGEHGFIKDDTRLHTWVQRRVWHRAARVICVSSVLRENLVARLSFPREKIQIIKNGVNLERFEVTIDSYEFRAALGIPPESLVFGSIGRFVPVKDYATLIKAAKVVVTKMPEARLVFCGDGPLKNDLAALAESLGIASHVHFLNWRDDIPKLLQVYDVFVLSSVSEGMSNAILEAMCAGRPVVATNVGGNPELVVNNKTGLLVPSQDPQQMGEAILALLSNTKRRQAMGDAGRQRIVSQFSLQGMVRNYERMYVEAASRHFDFDRVLQDKIERHFAASVMNAAPQLVE